MAFLAVTNVGKENERGIVLSDISFALEPFQKLAISGETGSGKSTLLKIIAGLVQRSSGEVFFNGRRVKGPEEKLLPGHEDIAYLSQQYELRNHYRVEELLDMANKMTDEAANKIYDICRISHLVKRRTDQLSGGEKQRIALARLLVTAPKLLILDEPYSNLDLIHKTLLKTVAQDISDQLKITCILASHDPLDVLTWADHIIVLKEGAIVHQAAPNQLYHQPSSPYTAALFGKYNLIPEQQTRQLETLLQLPPSGKQLFFRPENVTIHTEPETGSFSGVVSKVNFVGSYYEVTVATEYLDFTVITLDGSIKQNQAVFLTLNSRNFWYLPGKMENN